MRPVRYRVSRRPLTEETTQGAKGGGPARRGGEEKKMRKYFSGSRVKKRKTKSDHFPGPQISRNQGKKIFYMITVENNLDPKKECISGSRREVFCVRGGCRESPRKLSPASPSGGNGTTSLATTRKKRKVLKNGQTHK